MHDELIAAASTIRKERYPDADVVLLAGSLIRGEGTATSDLDLVVLFDQLPGAYRESFRFQRWPVEAFVHDPETLKYFSLHFDKQSGVPSLPSMVAEGVEVPTPTPLSRALKDFARVVLTDGPPKWSRKDVDRSRYAVTNFIEDLRDPRAREESMATCTELYGALANHYLRSRGLWSGTGKAIPKRLREADPEFAHQFVSAFEEGFETGDVTSIIELAESVLEPDGGALFEGYKVVAPREWRELA